MKRGVCAAVLSGLLLLSTLNGAAAAEPAEPEYKEDPAGTISFVNLSRRMREGNLQILALQESVDDLEEIDYNKLKEQLRQKLNEIASAQWMLVQFGQSGTLAYERMDQAYDALREQFDAIKEGDMQEDNADAVRQLRDLQDRIVMAGESTYIALSVMELQKEGLERQLSALDRQLAELELRFRLGHISSLALSQAQNSRRELDSNLATLRMNLNTCKSQLELFAGGEITGDITLGPLPRVTDAELEGMDLEKDLETAKENSWELYLAAKAYTDARKEYNSHGGDYGLTYKANNRSYQQARHNYYAAKYTYDKTVQDFELELRNLYLKTLDHQQIRQTAQAALSAELENCAAARMRYSQGFLSENALSAVEDKAAQAEEKLISTEYDLFSAYNTYRWAVDHGIL